MYLFLDVCECVVTANEIYSLYEVFMRISSSRVDDGVIDEQQGLLLLLSHIESLDL